MQFNNQGSICTFTPDNDVEKKWMSDNLETETWQWQGNSLVVDHRMAHDLVEVMQYEDINIRAT